MLDSEIEKPQQSGSFELREYKRRLETGQMNLKKEDKSKSFRPGKEGYVEFLEAMRMARQYMDNKNARG